MSRVGMVRQAQAIARWALAVVALMLFAASSPCRAADEEAPSPCGPVATPGHYGPFDYVTEHNRLEIVERFHFTPRVEALIGGSSGYLGGDLSYTLKASPNHHRALAAIVKWGERTKSAQPPYLEYSIDCFFDRAIRFRPEDVVVRALYAHYLGKQHRVPEAVSQLDVASDVAKDNGWSHYNIGLVYLELAQYDQALREAHRARKLGFDGDDLEAGLKRVNRWKDAEE